MKLLLRLLGPAALLCAGPVLAQEHVVKLTIEGEPAGVVLLQDSAEGLLIELSDVPDTALSSAARNSLRRVVHPGCRECVRVADLGRYEENSYEGTATLSLVGEVRPEKVVSLGGPRQPLPDLQQGLGLMVHYDVLGRRPTTSDSSAALFLNPRLSLGPLGAIKSGGFWIEQNDQTTFQRLETTLVRSFPSAVMTVEAGETFTDLGPNDPSSSILGLRMFRDFSIRPDITRQPIYNFALQTESTSTIELFINGQRQQTTEVNGAQAVRLTDYRPTGSGRAQIVVTDVLGNRQILETDLYVDAALLDQGQFDYSLTTGVLNNLVTELPDIPTAGGRFSVGVMPWLTAGISGQYAELDKLRPDLQRPRYSLGRLSTTYLSPLGKIEASGAYHEDPQGTSETYRGYWVKSIGIRDLGVLSFGGFFQDNTGLRTVLGRDIGFEGGRGFVGFAVGSWSLGLNAFEFREVRGYGASLGYRRPSWSLLSTVRAGKDLDPIYTASLSFYPQLAWLTRASFTARKEERLPGTELGAAFLGGTDRFSYSAFASRRPGERLVGGTGDDDHAYRGELQASYRGDAALAALTHRDDDAGPDSSLRIGGSMIWADPLRPMFYPPLSDNYGFAVIHTQTPGLELRQGSFSATTNRRGRTTLPVSGFGRRWVTVNPETLPYGYTAESLSTEVSVHSLHSARAELKILRPGVILLLPGVLPGDPVRIDGQERQYSADGLVVENAPRVMQVEFNGVARTVRLPKKVEPYQRIQVEGGPQ